MNQRIGYAHISTYDQHLESQRYALAQAGCYVSYEETVSGKSAVRSELEQCSKTLPPGYTLVTGRLDHLSRSSLDLAQIIADLEQRNIGYESLAGKIKTGSVAGKLVFHVFAALAEFERSLIRERTQAGLTPARALSRET
ncbi:recombinase family protein [Neopusillimonas aestuarii]|jgi:DNA invertase Pin-like site-specific DNA recombinase|uniref:recombinase family protein n=1 Tax=Neopusillimonas aestuarii TaxID=2716226 RepID=UPI00351B9BC7